MVEESSEQNVENEEVVQKIEVNPADVPLEIVTPKGDGIQMDLFDNV